MTDPNSQKNEARITEIVADLFDAAPPHSRADAEEELWNAGIDPGAVAERTEQLALARLGIESKRDGQVGSRRRQARRRLLGSMAALLALGVGAWWLFGGSSSRYVPEGLPQIGPRRPNLPFDSMARPNDTVDSHAVGRREAAEPLVTPPADAELEAEDRQPVPAPGAGVPQSIVEPVANVEIGETVTAENLDQHRSALSPGIEWVVRHGMRVPVVETKPVRAPRAYREATERYSSGVRLGADGLALEGYVAGLPFPDIDPTDPHAAVKIMWNHAHGFFATDDAEAADVEADTGALGAGGAPMSVERQFAVERFRRLFYNGRLFVDPRPARENPEGIRYREALYPIAEPSDLKGVGVTSIRYLSVEKIDDTWLYLPSLRRVRRLSSTQRSDALFDQDADLDSFFGYSGQIGATGFRFLGAGEVLAVMHAEHQPVRWGAGSADFAFDDRWEPRPVYVIEAVSILPNYAYGKRVLYIDQEAWVVLFSDIYDRSGELWKVWINMFSTRESAASVPSGTAGQQLILPASVVVDVQAAHATRMAVSGPRFPDSSGWRFNQGDAHVDENWFKFPALIERGD